jgi:3D (Asp-Asp-Asp) domain-containing protein/uncharacterized protein YabE (DUF348 family)
MPRTPGSPARSRGIESIVAVIFAAAVVVTIATGAVWATKNVNIVVGSSRATLTTRAETVGAALASAGVRVGSRDVVSPSVASSVRAGMTVTVRKPVPVVVVAGRDSFPVQVVGTTVADAIAAAGLDPGAGLVTQPGLTAAIVPGMRITATDVFTRIVSRETTVPFPTVKVIDPGLRRGAVRVTVKGSPGRKMSIYESLVTGGREGKRRLRAQRVLQAPVQRVVAVGVAASSKSHSAPLLRVARMRAAEIPTGGDTMRVVATAYSAWHGSSDRTATGVLAERGVIAVDPRVIPLGTRMYVPGYGYGIAADTGGAIKGARIDLCYDSESEVVAWGRRPVLVYFVH